MSRLVYFDCASGASGDMILGALVDMGLPLDALRAELARLGALGFRLDSRRVHRAGLHATKVDVVVEHPRGHQHRRLSDIQALLAGSTLADDVKERASSLFRRLAEAEAAVHGTGPEEVHFHEVGAVDSIVDVVGAVVGLAWLKADRFVASPLNVGSGTVTMSHGTFPVPPPATARLVKGAPVYGAGEGELLTPTGALLVTGYATSYGPLPLLRLDHVGHGAGSRETGDRPNVMRLLVGEQGEEGSDRVLVLEAEIDDMSPQLFGPLLDRLIERGALDAYLTPVHMKKGRPGVLMTALLPHSRREAVEELLFAETTTLGVRRQEWERTVLEREVVQVETAYGPIGVKLGRRGGRVVSAQPEFEDCARAAEVHGVPVKEAWAAAVAAFRSRR
ncbi:MAG TPA: nickel pincer cofactor biosynthesis protein LarC [Vicinamibacteria bacterium]|nr:nickel pincer cofactor biosynthesis protein LarC [Vicinamibacteria bacterium]